MALEAPAAALLESEKRSLSAGVIADADGWCAVALHTGSEKRSLSAGVIAVRASHDV